MTGRYLRNTSADYITGAVSACEGIRGSLVLLNGPLGCRFYHCYGSGHDYAQRSDLWSLRGELRLSDGMADSLLRSQYYAGTPQVPGTNLRYEDNIFGTREQLHRALNDIFAERSYPFFAVLQTPGTSLLGEALEDELDLLSKEYGVPYLFCQSPQFSTNACIGYDETIVRLLEILLPKDIDNAKKQRAGKRVNIFGLHTYQRHLEGDVQELARLLRLCGIEIGCAMGANWPLESVRTIPEADANIFLSVERCRETKKYLQTRLEMPYLDFGGLPIGFDLTERFVCEVCAMLGADPAAALEDIEESRARAFYCIARHMGSRGFPRELRYAVEGEASLLCGYVDYLSGYLGVRPLAIHALCAQECGEAMPRLEKILEHFDARDALEMDITGVQDAILLGSANTILEITAYSGNVYGIENMSPTSGYIDVLPKTHVGCRGALFLLEQMLNGARLLGAWKA